MNSRGLRRIAGTWLLLLVAVGAHAVDSAWTIGNKDRDDREFALAPDGYAQYKDDGYFVVGRSEARRDWPYVQPGPQDAWAGGQRHTFTVVFGLKTLPSEPCRLILRLVDANSTTPPQLRFEVNGKGFDRATTAGSGDASVYGNPAAGNFTTVEVGFPSDLLRVGRNEVRITTVRGSWILYDALSLIAPGATLADVTGTTVSSVRSDAVLVRSLGGLKQMASVTIRHFGEPTPAVIRVGDVSQETRLVGGTQVVDVLMPPVQRATSLPVTVSLPDGTAIPAANAVLKPVRKMVVYLLPHSHVDIGYTALQADVLKKQFSNLETAIELAGKTEGYPEGARFRWNAEVLWAVDAYMKQASPAKRAALLNAIRRGWIELDALYGNELTALCRPEELLHLVEPSIRLAHATGVPIRSAMITDLPGYTWGIVPALAAGGVRYFSIGPNPGDRIGATVQAWGDKPFWWISPSGNEKVLFWMAGSGYAWFHGQTLAQKGDGEILAYVQGLRDKGYPYDMVQVRYTTNGDNGAPDPTVSDTVMAWNKRYAYPKLVIATTTEMFRAFEDRYGRQIPRVRGDFTPYWEDGAASSALETGVNRAAAERLTQAEAIWARRPPSEFPKAAMEEAWRNVLLYDEHTWGAYNSISEPDSDFVKGQWAVKQAFALDADRQSRRLLDKALAPRGKPVRNAVDVFNTSSWDRTDLVRLPAVQSRAGDRVLGPDRKPVPSQRLSTGDLAFLARNVPAFGTKRYRIVPGRPLRGRARATSTSLHARGLDVSLDPATGAITTLRSAGVNLARKLNDYRYVAGRDPRTAEPSARPTITIKERGPLVATLRISSGAPGANSLIREVQVVDGLDRVAVSNLLDKRAVRTKEGVHFGYAFNIPNGAIRLDTPWAVVRPEVDQISGACKNWFTVQRWVDVSNATAGVTMATVDAPLVEIGGITAELPRTEHIAPTQTVYSYVMNNYWHTNYKADQSGPTLFRYAFRPHGEYDALAAARFGADVSQPLLAVPASGGVSAGSLLRLSPPGVVVTSLRPSLDGKAWIVRLFGASGKDTRTALSWGGPAPKSLYLSDLGESRGRRLKGAVEVPAWGIVTLRAEK